MRGLNGERDSFYCAGMWGFLKAEGGGENLLISQTVHHEATDHPKRDLEPMADGKKLQLQ